MHKNASAKPHTITAEISRAYLRQKFIYSIFGLLMGGIAALLGSILFVSGIFGGTSWTVSILGLKSNLTDAPPGAVLCFTGLAIVWITRHKIDYNLDDGPTNLRIRRSRRP